MKTVRYLDEARAEFLHEVEYFASVSPRLGERFDKAVQEAEARAAELPESGSPFWHGTRRLFPGKFKFSMVYLVRPNEIVIVALAPFRRRPGYWRSRLDDA